MTNPDLVPGYSKAEGESLLYLHKIVIEELMKREPGKLLEISPGKLRLWRQIQSLEKYEMYGCDIDCTEEFITYCDLNRNNLPYENDFFDYVICCEIIEHIHNPWKLISDIKRVLKPHQQLIITTPNVSKIIDRILYLFRGHLHSFGETTYHGPMQHINPINIRELVLILNEQSFDIADIKYNTTKAYQTVFPKGWFGYSVGVFAYKA